MKRISFVILSALTLAACSGDVKSNLGMKIDAPDEFAVERKPKLEVPPSFKLRAPAPGESATNATETRDEAKRAFLGSQTESSDGNTPAEKEFLSKVGASSANADIRQTIAKETPKNEDPSTLDKIRELSDKNLNKTLVDPDKEKARIDQNLKDNKPINDGETPTKSENDGKNIIDKIFN